MLNVLIVGASGYAGAELVNYMNRHEFAKIKKIFVSQNSLDIGKMFSEVHQQFTDIVNLKFESMSNFNISDQEIDVVFLATDHNVSHDLVPFFYLLIVLYLIFLLHIE